MASSGSMMSRRWLRAVHVARSAAQRQNKHRHYNSSSGTSASGGIQHQCVRWQSNGNGNNAPNPYLYPMRTEHPHITTTKASDLLEPKHKQPEDDKSKDLEALAQQKATLNTELHPKHKILAQPPSYIHDRAATASPFNNSSSNSNSNAVEENIPTTLLSNNISNNIRVASQEMPYGQIATIGVLLDVGSRHEHLPQYTGINHAMEVLAFQSSTEDYSASDISARMDALGGVTFANSSREQLLYCIDILRESVDEACAILAGTVLRPSLLEEELEGVRQTILFQNEEDPNMPNPMLAESKVMEGLHACAYKDQPLGRPHLCPVENVGNITADTLQQFRSAHFTADRIVVAGAGIEHEKLLELADKYFGHLTVPAASDTAGNVIPGSEASLYTGGECHQPTAATMDGLTRIAVAFELSGGWNELEGDLVPACVLQVLLGGGSSFSAGGPGKGMYSRLYREVLNRYYWVEAAEAFTSFHSESGLLGIKGACPGVKSRDLTRLFCEHMAKLAMFPVTDEELDRAKNMLKCNVLTQLESRLVLFEDIGRQILTYGKREGIGRTCERIDAVTKDDIMNIAKKALNKPPSISAVGEQKDLANVPTFDEVNGWFRGS